MYLLISESNKVKKRLKTINAVSNKTNAKKGMFLIYLLKKNILLVNLYFWGLGVLVHMPFVNEPRHFWVSGMSMCNAT